MQRDYVVSTLIRRHVYVMCPLGWCLSPKHKNTKSCDLYQVRIVQGGKVEPGERTNRCCGELVLKFENFEHGTGDVEDIS